MTARPRKHVEKVSDLSSEVERQVRSLWQPQINNLTIKKLLSVNVPRSRSKVIQTTRLCMRWSRLMSLLGHLSSLK